MTKQEFDKLIDKRISGSGVWSRNAQISAFQAGANAAYDLLSDGWIEIEKWSSVYEFSFQFWGSGNNNVYINKDGVELTSFGGEETINDILKLTLKWVNDKNPRGFKPKPLTKTNK